MTDYPKLSAVPSWSHDHNALVAVMRGEMWARFAAGEMSRSRDSVSNTAKVADEMLAEWCQRFIQGREPEPIPESK